MLFRVDDAWLSIHKPSNCSMLFIGGYVYPIDGAINLKGALASLETDLPPLFKKDKAGRWQTMRVDLQIKDGLPYKHRTIETPGLKTKEYLSPIKKVTSKYLTDSIQDQLQSTWNKKHNRDGWLVSQDDVALMEPMLLHHWDQYKEGIKYPAVIMPKLNGVRATWKPHVGLLSRKRSKFNVPHIEGQMEVLGITSDGELWAPGKSLEEIISLLANDLKQELEYHLFDRPTGSDKFIERMAVLIQEHAAIAESIPNIKVVPIAIVNDTDEAEAVASVIKKMPGVDGAVIRNMDHPYVFDTRSRNVLKMKDLISEEYTVVDVGFDQDALGKMIRFTFSDTTGNSFDYIPAWTKERRVEAYEKQMSGEFQHIGRNYTLTFREFSSKGIPKFITSIITERNYE